MKNLSMEYLNRNKEALADAGKTGVWLGIDMWKDALITYEHNHKNGNTYCADLANLKAEDVEEKIDHQQVDVSQTFNNIKLKGGLLCINIRNRKLVT